jgi:hypothetical protein
MKPQIELMRKVLTGLSEEVDTLSDQVKTKGVVPKEICESCKETNKRNVVDFSPEEAKGLLRFREWLTEMRIIAVSRSIMGRTFFKTSGKLAGIKSEVDDDSGYVYALPDLHDTRSAKSRVFSKYPKILGFLSKYDRIETCPHFEKAQYNILRIERHTKERVRYNEIDYVPRNLVKQTATQDELFLCCNACKETRENTMCDRVRKHGFLFDYDCPLEDIVLRKRLSQNGLSYEDLEEEAKTSEYVVSFPSDYLGERHGLDSIYYLRGNSIVITRSPYKAGEGILAKRLRDIVRYLTPKLITSFDNHSNLPSYLELQTDILFCDEDGVFYYDMNREPEKDMRKICEKIASSLNPYIEKQRGREHGRIVSAIYSIGQELGFVPQQEYGKSGIRIDCVWFDRSGKIQVAAEVETSSTFKKDLTSTWEVEPKLAVIIGDPKSDKVAESLMKFSLMKSIPHFVFYINKHTEHAFLFDKQEMAKFYELKQDEEETKKSTEVI